MNDTHLICLGVLIVAVYGIYMAFTPDPADGVLMSGVIGALCAVGGILYQRSKVI